jgi:hypothetical protein
VKARGAVHAVGVEQSHGWQFELRADCGQFLGQGGTFEKAESRAGVKFDVHRVPGTQLRLLTETTADLTIGFLGLAEYWVLSTSFQS